MNILKNGQDAFAQMAAGQNIECRHIASTEFDNIRNFPATVFFDADYEFRIAPRFMTIGHLDIDVPECIQSFDDLVKSQNYYIPSLQNPELPVEILNWHESELYLRKYIAMNLLHETKENAIAHARAFITLNGGSLDPVVIPEKIEEKPKKKRTSKAKENELESTIQGYQATISDAQDTEAVGDAIFQVKTDPDLNPDQVNALVEQAEDKQKALSGTEDKPELNKTNPVVQMLTDAIDKCESEYALQAVENNIKGNQHELHHAEYEQLKQRIKEKRMSFFPADNDLVSKVINAPIEDQHFDDYVAQIEACAVADDLGDLSQKIIGDDKLNIDQQEQLINLTKNRVSELSPTPAQPSLIEEIDQQATKVVQDKIHKDAMAGNAGSYPIDMLYNQKKKMLIGRIYDMDSIKDLERLAPAIPAAKLNPEDHQELLNIYAERKTAMQQADA